MLILALDTTTRAGSVALTRDDEVVAALEGDGSRTHGERLPAEIDRVLAAAAVAPRALDLLVVASGPGAFTGLRIGLAAVQGLAMVVGTPVVGVSALDALAAVAWPEVAGQPADVVTWMDAQRGEVFSARYAAADAADGGLRWPPATPPLVAPPARVLGDLSAMGTADPVFIGDGAARYAADIAAWSQGRARVLPTPGLLAPALARLGRRRADAGEAGPPHALQPLYIRRPDAELDRARRGPA